MSTSAVAEAEEVTISIPSEVPLSRDLSLSLKQTLQLSLIGKEASTGKIVPGTPFLIDAVQPSTGCRASRCTRIKLRILSPSDGNKSPSTSTVSTPLTLADQLGGMERTKDMLLEVVLLPILLSDLFSTMGISPPRGVLLKGPPGVGKTAVIRLLAQSCAAKLIMVSGAQGGDVYAGDTEARLRAAFEEAGGSTRTNPQKPVIVFIDEIDVMCPSRTDAGSTETRVVAQLLTLLDGMKSRGNIVVIGATNRPNALDIALRRPGRFDREIDLHPPDPSERAAILRTLTRTVPLASDVVIEEVAGQCLGYVGADLIALVKEAFSSALRRQQLSGLRVSALDFRNAVSSIVPSAQREVHVSVPRVTWDDIGGLADVKRVLIEAIEWPLRHRDAFQRLGIAASRGVLLHGPPGCSKTTLVKAAANYARTSFLTFSGAAIFAPYLGAAEAIIRGAFKKCRDLRPAILFLDEIDGIVGKRTLGSQGDGGVQERVLSTLLNEMDGLESAQDVIVVAATNRLDMIDSALLRPGRLEHILYVPLPDLPAREQILRIHTRAMPLADDVDVPLLAKRSEGKSGAELENMCREAALMALREDLNCKQVALRHFTAGMSLTP